MKRIFAVLFLAIALVSPALAEDMNLELIPKIGYLFSPEVTQKIDTTNSHSKDSTISIGAELFFDMQNNLFLGFGLMWGQNHKFNSASNNKIGFTNIYGALKYKFLVNDSKDEPLFLYPLIQLGFGVPGWEYIGYQQDYIIEGRVYWCIGVGGEYKNVILEFIYGCNYAAEKYVLANREIENDCTYTAFRINVGYKFVL